MRIAMLFIALLLTTACAGTAQRASDPNPRLMKDIGTFLEYQEEVRAGFEDGTLGDLNEHEMELLVDSQNSMERLLTGIDSVDELSANQQVELYNAQEAINAIIRGNVESRQICRRQVKTLGTNIRKTECYTARQREEMLRIAQRNLDWVRRNSGQCADCNN